MARKRRTSFCWACWLLCVALALSLMSCGVSEDSLVRIRREGAIRIGYAVEEPFAYLDASGAPTGESIEVAKRIVERMEIPRIEWILTEFGSLLYGLEAGRFDAVSSGVFITPERAKRVSFSEPTFRVRQALLVQAGNPLELHSYEDVARQANVKIAVLEGAIEEAIIRSLGISDARVMRVPDALTGRVAVESGAASALALSAPSIHTMVRNQELGRTEVAEPFHQPSGKELSYVGYGGIVFRKSDTRLLEAWNREQREFVGSAAHRSLLAQFGLGEDALPGNVSTEMILSGAGQ